MSSASRCEKNNRKRGQATIEAAFAIPVLMVLMLMIIQPSIILYDKVVMADAAAEGCRMLTTSSQGQGQLCEDFIRRRLSAVPQVDIFHVHTTGCSWDIQLSGNQTTDVCTVSISTEVKPLPLFDIASSLTGALNERGNLTVKVDSSMDTQPSWVDMGSGPNEWIRSWV